MLILRWGEVHLDKPMLAAYLVSMVNLPNAVFLDKATPPHIGTLVLLTGLGALAMNVFLPSLPEMTTYFDTEYGTMQLSVALYLAFSGVMQLFIGPISDKYGRRKVLLWSLVVFLLATLGCVLATSVEVFLVFRMIQAVIAVSMVLTRAVVRDLVPQDQAASMIGYITMGMAVVPMIGPAIGGLLDQWFGWQSNFWLLLVIGLLCLWLIYSDLGETAPHSDHSMLGQFAQFPELFRSPRFWGYCLAAAFCSGAFFAYLGGAPYVGSEVFGLDSATVGFFFGAPAIGYFLGNYLTGRLATRLGINRLILIGAATSTLGCILSLLVVKAGYGSPVSFFGFMTFVGMGNGLCIANANAGMLSVRPHLAGTASGLGGAIMIGGGAGLSALAGVLLAGSDGPEPLIYIMGISSALAILAIGYVIRREKALGAA